MEVTVLLCSLSLCSLRASSLWTLRMWRWRAFMTTLLWSLTSLASASWVSGGGRRVYCPCVNVHVCVIMVSILSFYPYMIYLSSIIIFYAYVLSAATLLLMCLLTNYFGNHPFHRSLSHTLSLSSVFFSSTKRDYFLPIFLVSNSKI